MGNVMRNEIGLMLRYTSHVTEKDGTEYTYRVRWYHFKEPVPIDKFLPFYERVGEMADEIFHKYGERTRKPFSYHLRYREKGEPADEVKSFRLKVGMPTEAWDKELIKGFGTEFEERLAKEDI